jgi:4-diphosphocytidyl-2-C-methyl-D-erythritol kinase
MARVTVKAPGKINLALHVGPLEASGYHDLLSVFQAVDVWETLTAEDASEFSLTVSGDVVLDDIPLDENNLVIKAARAVQRVSGFEGAASFHIDKKVPVGGGMAGGSADAAAALVAVDSLWGTELSQVQLLELAAELGSDVPFSLEGYTQIGRGRGHLLERIDSLPFHWVIVPQTLHLSTPLVYSTLDGMRGESAPAAPSAPSQGLVDALFTGDAQALAGELVNDLAAAAMSLAPQIQSVLDTGAKLGALAGMVSGSGPTCVFLVEDAEHQAGLVDGFETEGLYALSASSPARGAHLLQD